MTPFVARQLDAVDLSDLEGLVDRQIPESLHLDYKELLQIDGRDARLEFLKDISAFANSDGGFLIYGIKEGRDSTGKPNGLPSSIPGFEIPNVDALMLQLSNIVRDGIDERLFGRADFHVAPLSEKRGVLIVRIPPSLRKPHMISFAGDRRFYHRTNVGCEPMSTAQIRDAVLQSQTAIDGAKAFVQQRIRSLHNWSKNKRFLTLHFVPLSRRTYALDVTSQELLQKIKALPFEHMNGSSHSVDGFSRYNHGQTTLQKVTFFRDGCIEYVDIYELSGEQYKYWLVEREVMLVVSKIIQFLGEQPTGLPALLVFQLNNLSAYPFFVEEFRQFISEKKSMLPDGDLQLEPELIVNDATNVASLMQRPFDVIWNAAGFSRCDGYDKNGDWRDYGDARVRLEASRKNANPPAM